MFFFILPVGVDYRARRYPVVTFTLMGLCTLIYLVTELFNTRGSGVQEWVFENLWLIPAESHWWSYFTSMFVHAGFLHLAGNMIYLFLFGSCVEDLIGRARFILFYLGCGLIAAFAEIAFSPNHFASEIPFGGASGAISGCIGGFLLLLARTKIEFKWVFLFWLRIWSGEFFLPAWIVISVWFLQDFAGMALKAASSGHAERGGTAFAAHVGGTLCGLGLMPLIRLWSKLYPVDEEEVQVATPTRVQVPGRPQVAARLVSSPPDAENPTIYLHAAGLQSGPFTLAQIQKLFSDGAVSAQTFYWQEGMDDWRDAEELRQPGVV